MSFLLIKYFLLLSFIEFYSAHSASIFDAYPKITPVSKDELNIKINETGLTAVYFYTPIDKNFDQRLEAYLQLFSSSYDMLRQRDIHLVMVNCEETNITEYCSKENSYNLITFQAGEKLVDLSQDHVFDEDALVSNLLQLRLLDYVSVIIERKELVQLEHDIKGKENAVFAFFEAIGSKEHRALMEVALDFKDDIKMSMTTDNRLEREFRGNMTRISQTASMWVMKCKDTLVTDPNQCRHIPLYEKMTEKSVTRLFKSLLTSSEVYEMKGYNGDSELDRHMIYVLRDNKVSTNSQHMLKELIDNFSPVVAIAVIDVDSENRNTLGIVEELPMAVLHIRRQPDLIFADPKTLVNHTVVSYLRHQLEVYASNASKFSSADSSGAGGERHPEEIVRTEDNLINKRAAAIRLYTIDLSALTSLTDDNFQSILHKKEPSRKIMVLYHLRFDSRSKVLLYLYSNVSHATDSKSVMAYVDCHDWKKVCDHEEIIFYPQIFIYTNGRRVTYKGRVDPESLIHATCMLKKDNILELSNMHEVNDFIAGKHPTSDGACARNISVMGLVTSKPDEKEFRLAAEEFCYFSYFGVAKGKLAEKLSASLNVKLPALIVYRHTDQNQPTAVFSGKTFTYGDLAEFVSNNQLPIFPELTEKTYPSVMKEEKHIAILFTDTRQCQEWETMAKIAAAGVMSSQIAYSWMDVSNNESLSASIFQTYTYNSGTKPPKLAILYHKLASVYFFSDASFDSHHITAWMSQVLSEKVEPSYKLSETTWEPTHSCIDYLKLADETKEREKSEREEGINNDDEDVDLLDEESDDEMHGGDQMENEKMSRRFSERDMTRGRRMDVTKRNMMDDGVIHDTEMNDDGIKDDMAKSNKMHDDPSHVKMIKDPDAESTISDLNQPDDMITEEPTQMTDDESIAHIMDKVQEDDDQIHRDSKPSPTRTEL